MKDAYIFTDEKTYPGRVSDLVPVHGFDGYFFGLGVSVLSGSTYGKLRQLKIFPRYNGQLYVALTDNHGVSRNRSYQTIVLASMSPLMAISRHDRATLDSTLKKVIKSLPLKHVFNPAVLEKYTMEELKLIHPGAFLSTKETLAELY